MTIDFKLLDRALSILTAPREDALVTIPAVRLPERDEAAQLLTVYQEQIKGRDIQVAATYYAACWRVIPAALLYTMSMSKESVNWTLQNLTIQIGMVNNYPRFFFVLNECQTHTWPVGTQDDWREQVLGSFVRDTLKPVLETAAAVSKLPVTQLWGQMPLGIEFYLNYLGDQIGEPACKDKFKDQFHYLTKDLGAAWFGLQRNPFDLKEKWIEDPHRPGELMRMKPTCCLAYRTDTDHGYCYGCPKMSKAERESRRNAILAAAKTKAQ